MSTKIIIDAVFALCLGYFVMQTLNYKQKYQVQKENAEMLEEMVIDLRDSYNALSESVEKLSKQKTYSISLAPNVNSKVVSTLGSSKNLTFQYYFTMDGNKLEILPDSAFVLKK